MSSPIEEIKKLAPQARIEMLENEMETDAAKVQCMEAHYE